MKALLIILMFVSSAAAEPFRFDLPTLCDSTGVVIKNLEGNYKEKLSWSGHHVNDASVYSLWVNEKTGTWTLLKMTPETACIIGVGDQSHETFGLPV